MNYTILGTGSYLPERVVTNADMEKLVDTSDEWIRTRTGIKTRHYSTGETGWYMALQACQRALEAAQMSPKDIDAIFVSSATPDYMVPSTSCILQGELGAENAFAIDINVACAGYIYVMDMAARYLASPNINHVLVVSTEQLTARTNFNDRNTCVLFGDAASATVVGKEGSGEILTSILGADGTGGHLLVSKNFDPENPFLEADWQERWPDRFEGHIQKLYMNGAEVYRFAVRKMSGMIKDMVAEVGLTIEDIDYMIPHQANTRILEAAAKRLKFPMEKMYTGIEKMGNTSSAGLGVGIDECVRTGTIKSGDLVAMSGFGGGLTYGALLLRI